MSLLDAGVVREIFRVRVVIGVGWVGVLSFLVLDLPTYLFGSVVAGLVIGLSEGMARKKEKRTPTAGWLLTRALVGLLLGVIGTWMLVSQTISLFIGFATVGIGLWITGDAMARRNYRTVTVPIGPYHRAIEEIDNADVPLSTRDVASACDLSEERAADVTTVLQANGDIEHRDGGFVTSNDHIWPWAGISPVIRRLARPLRHHSLYSAE